MIQISLVPLARKCAVAALLGITALAAQAQIKVGVDLSETGSNATIGITSKNAIAMFPKTLGGQPAQYIFLDDGSDPGIALRNVRRLLSDEKVDVIIGPTVTPAALAALPAVAEAKTPMITLVGSGIVVEPVKGDKVWAYKMAATDTAMADVLTRYMSNHGVKTIAFIGFADGYGEGWLTQMTRLGALRGIKIIDTERFNRNDTSVSGQILKMMESKPDALFIAAAGTPAVLPEKTMAQYGWKGPIYQTHGIATPEFLQIGGKSVEGTLFPTQPVVVAHTLPADHPVRKAAMDFVSRYEAKYGANSVTQFAGDAAGVYPLLDAAVARALKTTKPGTVEFREAVRAELEQTHDLMVPQGVVNTSPTDHVGLDQRASVMGIVKNGKFTFLSQ